MPWYSFSRSSVGITLEDALAIANENLENARNAQDANNPTKALYLCRSANDAIKDAKKTFSNKRGGDKRDDGIANAYQKRGEILEKLGQHKEAQRSYRKAKKWGYIEVAVFRTDTILSSKSDHPIHLCPSSELLETQDTTPSDIADLMPVSIKDSARAPQKIFGENVPPPIATIALPELGGRITSTSQLTYCLSLLNHSMVSKEELSGPESDWLLAASNDPDEQQRLQTLTTDVIRAFIRDDLKGPDAVAETMTLAPVLEQDDFRKLLGVFVDGVEQSLLLEIHLLDGLAFLMKNAPPGSLDPDDLVKILELLRTRLKDTHQQSTEHTYQLVQTVSRVLDSMVDSQVEGIDRESLHEPLSLFLEKLKQSSDPRLVYQAAYAYQALQYIPDNETILQSMLRRTEKVVQGVSGVVSAVKALDINGFIDGLQSIQGGLEGVEKAISVIKDAYSNVKTLAESGQELMESLKEGLSFTHRSAWYPALRGLDALWQEGRFAEFEKLINEAPCRTNPAFQWGVSYLLGELASKAWDTNTRQCAVSFLGEMYTDDARWGQQVNVKQWILRIIGNLTRSSEGDVASHAKKLLQDLESVGDSAERALYVLYQAGNEESRDIFMSALQPPQEPRLLSRVQGKADVETPLRQLKLERLKERGGDVYVSPRAKLHASAKDDFDLTSKVQEFLNGNKKVFLLLGDSGSGKSTFNRALEIELWDKYNKTVGPIPLFIHLPAIDKPEQELIEKQLRHFCFTESQIRELKLHHEFILICDGYDESQQTRNLYMGNQLNQTGQWRAKMVISCRTEYAGVDYRSCFCPTDTNGEHLELFQEAIVTPFSKAQIQDYIDQYVTLMKPSWGSDDYLHALNQIPNLQDLVTNPFLLKISLEVLPRLFDVTSDFSAVHITRVQLYDGFVAQWIERSLIRLSEMELSPRDKEALKVLLDAGFDRQCIAYLKQLAVLVYDNQGGSPMIEYSERRDQKTWKKTLFSNHDGKNLLREAIPIIRNNDRYRFLHKSVLEYSLALSVYDPSEHGDNEETAPNKSRRGSVSSILSFERPDSIQGPAAGTDLPLLESPLGRRSYVDELSVSQFLVERVQQQPVFKEQLLSVIERSKTDKSARIVAANAITILVRADVQFVGADLRGILIPGADLSYGMFDMAQLDGADLRKANLYNIWLRKASLCGAQMTGVKFGELPLIQAHGYIHCCAYSPDGEMIAVGRRDGPIEVYDISSGELIQWMSGHSESVTCLLFSEESDKIASGSRDNEFQLWDIETGECTHTLNCGDTVVRIFESSPNGYRVISQGGHSTLKLWDTETGECLHTLQGHTQYVIDAAFSPNGDLIATGGVDRTVKLWRVDTGECIKTFTGDSDHSDMILTIDYSPDGSQVATGSLDRTIKLWDVETGDCVHTLEGHKGDIFCLAFSPDGREIASGGMDQTVRLWSVETGDCTHTLNGHAGGVMGIVYLPDKNQIASGSWDFTIRLWKVETRYYSRDVQGHTGMVYSIARSPNGDEVVSGSWDNTVARWDIETGQRLHVFHGHTEPVLSVAYSPKGHHVISGGNDNTARLWSVDTGDCVHVLEGHNLPVYGVAYKPDGSRVASGSEDHTVRLWDTTTGNCLYTLDVGDNHVRWIEFSPVGDRIASGNNNGTVCLWDVETGNSIHTFRGHSDMVPGIAYSPNGDQIASASDDTTVRLWDVETGECLHILEGHRGVAYRVAYSPKGDLVASGSFDNTMRLWDVKTGNCIHTFEGHGSGGIHDVLFSPNGEQVVSGGNDNTVRLWDVKTGQILVVITGFSGPVRSIIWQDTPDGTFLITGSDDKSVRRWKITKDQDEYQVHLCWSSSNDGLVVAEATFKDASGLTQINQELLKQRGALETSVPSAPSSPQ